ncbi:MAG: hypothetical protein WBG10_01415 [Pseudolabrys sp.]
MRDLSALFAISLALLLFGGDAGMAQTTQSLSNGALRRQDKQDCTNQAAQQNIVRRNLADFVRKCMADRQAERKKNAADESRPQKGMAAEEWAAIQEVRNRERRQQLEQEAAKRADCNKQANQQKFRLVERRRFIKKCVAQ